MWLGTTSKVSKGTYAKIFRVELNPPLSHTEELSCRIFSKCLKRIKNSITFSTWTCQFSSPASRYTKDFRAGNFRNFLTWSWTWSWSLDRDLGIAIRLRSYHCENTWQNYCYARRFRKVGLAFQLCSESDWRVSMSGENRFGRAVRMAYLDTSGRLVWTVWCGRTLKEFTVDSEVLATL